MKYLWHYIPANDITFTEKQAEKVKMLHRNPKLQTDWVTAKLWLQKLVRMHFPENI